MTQSTFLSWSLMVVASAGCANGTATMRSIQPVARDGARCLVVLLPGYGDSPETFETQGLAELLRASGASVDVIAANATMDYHRAGTFVERLHTDVIQPAQAAHSYEQLWLMGVSMGGYGSLHYASQREGEVSGVFAIASYLGDAAIIEEIEHAGGLRSWPAPQKEPANRDNYQAQLWRWLQEVTARQPDTAPALYVGYGREDRLARGNALVAAALPGEYVFVTDGGHRWTVWKGILGRYLAESSFTRVCAPKG